MDIQCRVGLYTSSEDLNSRSYACLTTTLPTDPFPLPTKDYFPLQATIHCPRRDGYHQRMFLSADTSDTRAHISSSRRQRKVMPVPYVLLYIVCRAGLIVIFKLIYASLPCKWSHAWCLHLFRVINFNKF